MVPWSRMVFSPLCWSSHTTPPWFSQSDWRTKSCSQTHLLHQQMNLLWRRICPASCLWRSKSTGRRHMKERPLWTPFRNDDTPLFWTFDESKARICTKFAVGADELVLLQPRVFHFYWMCRFATGVVNLLTPYQFTHWNERIDKVALVNVFVRTAHTWPSIVKTRIIWKHQLYSHQNCSYK